MNKRTSRRQFLAGLAAVAGGLGLTWAARLLKAQEHAAENLTSTPFPRIDLPFVVCQRSIYDWIRREALALNSEKNHPLPLLGSWNASTWWNHDTDAVGLNPGWQLEMVAQGHHILPWFEIPTPDDGCQPDEFCYQADYFESPLKKAAYLHLPISFVGTQWEHYLYDDPIYFDLPPSQNPNVVLLDGTIQKRISPFGSVGHWYEVGQRWGSNPLMQQLIAWYPDPPGVIFISNNEATRLTWPDAEIDQHYVELYGYGRDDNFKRRVFSDGWNECYTALFQGFRNGLGNTNWQACSKFIGYGAFGPGWFGEWPGWKEYSLYVPGRIDPHPLFWQGGSPSLYICTTCNERDNNVQGPLFDAMNWLFIANEALQLNPSFWYEFSSWDGDQEAQDGYARVGQSLTPERYGGFVQFGMWVVRPRTVRVYRDWNQGRAAILPWFMPVMNAVDRIYTNPTLLSFWRNSTLVSNPSREHPYESDIPPEYSFVDRMFLLSTNLDPVQPWSLDTEFPVMGLARVTGISPKRQWLLYAYAPLGSKMSVQVAVPEYQTVTVNVALGGSFYLVDELTRTVTSVDVV